ncbi:hypothetical protein [Telmatospirillum sp.]|uniref:hypothetical protein n=1 Tax=Telmatospirillum sp. TaxID=2079197 RepID=UPI00284330E2|nr:hypothetical protein [Telmatospirillum sp.]MDR3437965.1 hypothetical protein [Telmatospirillum sp.]
MDWMSRRAMVTGLFGASMVLGTTRRAFAFSEDTPNVRTLALHENACGATASHKELVAEVERTLGDSYSPEEKKRVMAALTCPICGCPLSGLF